MIFFILYEVLSVILIFAGFVECFDELDNAHFTNSWAVHIKNGNHKIANEIAKKHGFINFGQIGSLPGYFHFVHEKKQGRRHRREVEKTSTLLTEEKIQWVQQQQILERDKRSVVPDYVPVVHPTGYPIQDPLYNDQWYLNNVGQSSGPSGLDINVLPVWSRGISGKNVVVAILDDGLDHTHPDLRRNYDPSASYDFNDYDEDPMPRDEDPNNCHGTKCAGEVAAEAGNGVCGVGVAFNSSIAGIRMLDGDVTDTIEGGALSYKKDYIDVYSCAWGPKDDGKRFGRPGTLASKALELGVRGGRNSLGSIFIWATGNGGLTDDDCNCDGYTTSVYTVSVGAISDHGLSTYYTESCASTLAVTYSGGSHREKKENKIITTTLNHKCSNEFKGTSSAAPLAAGMVALMLEANGNLTWRDVQHIIVETSLMTSALDEGWRRNGAGKWFNQKFGFGRMDASAMIDRAQGWTNVNKQKQCWSDTAVGPWNIPSSGTVVVSVNSSACADTSSSLKTLEHVQVVITLKHRHRGHVSIELVSPSGTRTRLLKTRRNDKSTKGLKDWVFMSVHFWGEDPRGTWTLAVTDNSNNNRQHHKLKSRYGDLEDATQILQDEMDGKSTDNDVSTSSSGDEDYPDAIAVDSYKSAENFENGVFKDDSFRKKSRKNSKLIFKGNTAQHIVKKLKNHKKFSKLRKKTRTKVNTERLKEKLREHLKSPLKHIRKYDNKHTEGESESMTEEKILEEILKEIKSNETTASQNIEKPTGNDGASVNLLGKGDKLSRKPDTSNSSGSSLSPSTNNSISYANHNATSEIIPPPPPSVPKNASMESSKLFEKNTSTDKSINTELPSPSKNNNGTETDILEGLLKTIISDVFGNFLVEQSGSKSFDERISSLESLLGRNATDSDPISSSLQKAFKSGKAIDRVNNVISVLENGKNDSKLANTTFTQSADVVIDVLKVLKDVLSTEKTTTNLKGYKQRISNLLESQSNTTQALTERLLKDLKPTHGSNSNNETADGVVDDALGLISQIFEDRQKKFEGPDSELDLPYSSFQNVTTGADGSSKEISTTSASKVIHHNNNHVEKITLEHLNVNKNNNSEDSPAVDSKNENKKKVGGALNDPSSSENKYHPFNIHNGEGNTAGNLPSNERQEFQNLNSNDFSNRMAQHKNNYDNYDREDSKVKNNDNSFVVTITKNGEGSGDKYSARTHKKMETNKKPTDDENIDIEVLVDGQPKQQPTDTIDLSNIVENLNSDQTSNSPKPYVKQFELNVNEALTPKLMYDDRGNKKTTLLHSSKSRNSSAKKSKKKRQKHNNGVIKKNQHDITDDETVDVTDESPFSFVQFNDMSQMSPIPIVPDELSESIFSSDTNDPNIPTAPFELDNGYPTLAEERASLYDSSYGNDEDNAMNSFERPFDRTNFDVAKRSRVAFPNFEESNEEPRDFSELLTTLFNDRVYESEDISGSQETHLLRNTEDRQHVDVIRRRRRSVDNDDRSVENSNSERELVRQKRNIIDEDDDDFDDGNDGPHVVKRSAIFSELYPSQQPLIRKLDEDDDDDTDEEEKMTSSRSLVSVEATKYMTSKIPSADVNEKRSSVRKALSLENTLRHKLISMRKESSSVLGIIRRVHTDIAHGDSKDLRTLEKELASLEPSSRFYSPPQGVSSFRSSIEKSKSTGEKAKPVENFMNLIKETENSTEKDEVSNTSTDDSKQNPDEYYKYGTATSGILLNWTLKFYGTA